MKEMCILLNANIQKMWEEEGKINIPIILVNMRLLQCSSRQINVFLASNQLSLIWEE